MFRKVIRWLNWMLAAVLIVGLPIAAARSEVIGIILFVGLGGGLFIAEVIRRFGLWPPES
jgi:hypothetical protein